MLGREEARSALWRARAILGAVALLSAACAGKSHSPQTDDHSSAGSGGTSGESSAGGLDSTGGLSSTGVAVGGMGAVSGAAGNDPECSFWGYADDDGDGRGSMSWVCADTYPGAVSGLYGDCDDTDPSVSVAFWLDEDGDGAGASGALGCFAPDVPPEGYASNGTDCNDTDANIGPFVLDRAGDGVDADCDGLDGVTDCASSSRCVCQELAPYEPASATCDRFDLAILDVTHCRDLCGRGTSYVRLLNLGAAAISGAIELDVDAGLDELERYTLPGGLGPRSASAPLAVRGSARAIRISSEEGEDCELSNNEWSDPEEAGMRPLCIPK